MAIYNKDSKLLDAIMASPSVIPVINRLGITLGVGDSTIGSICSRGHIDADFFLSVINTFLDQDYFPVNARSSFSIAKTMEYLEKTSAYYSRVQLPNIDRHFQMLLEKSGNDNNLGLLKGFFSDVKSEMTECLTFENEVVFPSLKDGIVPDDVDKLWQSHSEVEEKLHDLLYFFVVHLRGDYDRNLCVAVVTAVSSLERDYAQNNRIRNRILLPLIEEMKTSQNPS